MQGSDDVPSSIAGHLIPSNLTITSHDVSMSPISQSKLFGQVYIFNAPRMNLTPLRRSDPYLNEMDL